MSTKDNCSSFNEKKKNKKNGSFYNGQCFVTQKLIRDEKIRRMMDFAEEIILQENFNIQNFTLEFNEKCKKSGIEGTRFSGSWVQFIRNVKNRFEKNNYEFENADDERFAAIQRNFDPYYCIVPPRTSNRRKLEQHRTKSGRKLHAKIAQLKKCSKNVVPLNVCEENNERHSTDHGRRKKSIPRKRDHEAPPNEQHSSPHESQSGAQEGAKRSRGSVNAVGQVQSQIEPLHSNVFPQNHIPDITFLTNGITTLFQRHYGNIAYGVEQNNGPKNSEDSEESNVVEAAAQAKNAHGTPPPPSSNAAARVSVSSSPDPMPPIYNFIHPAPPQNLRHSTPAASQTQNIPSAEPHRAPSAPPSSPEQQQFHHQADATIPATILQLPSAASTPNPNENIPSIESQQDPTLSGLSNMPPPPPPPEQLYHENATSLAATTETAILQAQQHLQHSIASSPTTNVLSAHSQQLSSKFYGNIFQILKDQNDIIKSLLKR